MDQASHDRTDSAGGNLRDHLVERVERALRGHDISRCELEVVVAECERQLACRHLPHARPPGIDWHILGGMVADACFTDGVKGS